jgi:glycerol-3-phosphate dehydrogenase
VSTAPVIVDLAQRHHVDMPITATVAALLEGRIGARDAITTLMSRQPTSELRGLVDASVTASPT